MIILYNLAGPFRAVTFDNLGYFKILSRLYTARFLPNFHAPCAELVPVGLKIRHLEILEFYTDSSTCEMGTFIDIEMGQYMLLMYNSIKQRRV